jgi:hypothetical protein
MENETRKRRRIPKWPFLMTFILLAAGGTGYYYYSNYIALNRWKPFLQKKLKELILRSSDSLYRIEYADFDFNLSSGDILLRNFKLAPDMTVYEKLVKLKKAPDNLFILSVKNVSIKSVDAIKAYKEKIMDVKSITIDKPELTIINKRYHFNDTVRVGKPKTPYQVIEKIFRQVKVGSFALKDISLSYADNNGQVTMRSQIKNLDINISELLVDSLSSIDTTRFYYTKGIEFTLRDYQIATPDSMYTASLKKIYFSTAQRKIILEKASFLPRYNKDEFYRITGHSTDIFYVKFNQISLGNIDLQRFLREQKLFAASMDITGADVEIYHNNAWQGRKTIKTGKDPQQALQKLALDMKLAKLNVYNSAIRYAEADRKSGYTGVITFDHTTGHFNNVTNDPDAKKANPYLTADIRTTFMNAAPLNVMFKFKLTDKDGAFSYAGALRNLDGRKLDKLVKPLAMIHVKSADVERLSFAVDANNFVGKGKVEFYYKNLNIEILKKVKGVNTLQKQGFISKLANTLIIKDSNPDKGGNFRPGPVNFRRDPSLSFFSFLYKCLLDGIKPSVGYSKNMEGDVNDALATGDALSAKNNRDKQERKEKRQKEKQVKKEVKANEKTSSSNK